MFLEDMYGPPLLDDDISTAIIGLRSISVKYQPFDVKICL